MGKINTFYRIFLPALLLTLIIAWACKEDVIAPDNETYEISGQLLDEEDFPISGAILQVFSEDGIQSLITKDTTDDNGYFTLKNLPENNDNLEVRIEHEFYQPASLMLKEMIKSQDKKNIKIKMQHDTDCTGKLYIKIKDTNENPINDAELRLNKKEKTLKKSHSNENGEVYFKNICPGEYWLRIYKYGFKVIEHEFSIEKGDSLNLNFTLVENEKDTCCQGIIYLTIKDSTSNEPVSNVKVRLWKGKEKIKDGYTDKDGKISFEDICEGNYQISFFKDGYNEVEFNFEMGCNDTLEFNKFITKKDDSCCKGVIYLVIQDSTNNQGIENVNVNLWKDGKLLKEEKTNAAGLVKFTDLCEGKYSFAIKKEGYKSFEFFIKLGCNDTLEINKKMLKMQQDSCCDGKIILFVKDSTNNESINGAKVNLWRSGKLYSSKKTENGKVIFEKLCEGKYGIDIQHEKYKNIEFEIELACNQIIEITKNLIPVQQKDSCCNGVIKVAVFDKESKRTIKGAKVKLWFGGNLIYQETFNEEPLIINELCQGKYQFTFIAEGYKSAEESIVLGCNDTIYFPFFMEPLEKDSCCDGKFKLSLRDSTSNEIILGATVKLWKNGKVIKEGKTKEEWIIFEGLCKGRYSVTISHENYKTSEFSIEIPCNETIEMIKYLSKDSEPCCDGKVKIKPVDINTKLPIKNATVKLWKDGQIISQKVVEEEYVIFEKLCKGKYGVDIVHEKYKNIEFSFELGCNETKSIVKELEPLKNDSCCNGVIYVNVKDSLDNSKLKSVLAKLWRENKVYKYGYTDETGHYSFENVCQGKYILTLTREGYKSREININVECNDTLELNYKLLKDKKDTCETAEVLIKVKNKVTKEPIPGAVIKIYDRNNNLIAEGVTNEMVNI